MKTVLLSALLLANTLIFAQENTSTAILDRPVLKASLLGPITPIGTARLGLEYPINSHSSFEVSVGYTFTDYNTQDDDQFLPRPEGRIAYYHYFMNPKRRNPGKVGAMFALRQLAWDRVHTPCLEYEYVPNGWFPYYDCSNEIVNEYNQTQTHVQFMLMTGKSFRSRKFIWDVNFGMGLQYVQTIRSNYIESVDRPEPSLLEGLDFGNYDQPKLDIDDDEIWPVVFLDVTIGKKNVIGHCWNWLGL